MRKIFIDCGGHDGCSIRMFNEIIPDANEFEKYTFEPNPKFKKYYQNLDTKLISSAVHNYTGKCNFYMQTSNVSAGSSVDKRKKNLSKWNQIEVSCIRLSDFIQQFDIIDYIVLKLDIEGLEYDVLEDLIHTGAISYINKIFAEFHCDFLDIDGIEQRHNQLLNTLKKINLEPLEWDALHYRLDCHKN